MNSEEKIRELTERIEKLEKAENKRVIKRRIQITFSIIKLLIIIVLLIMAYNYIKPYKEKIDNVTDKVDKVENYIDSKLGGLNRYFH